LPGRRGALGVGGIGEPVDGGLHHPQIAAGAESATRAGEHDRANVGVARQLLCLFE
jgi:hypothetical protein